MIDTGLHSKVVVVQLLIVADVVVSCGSGVVIRHSLLPLEVLTKVMGRVKEGFYGEKISLFCQTMRLESWQKPSIPCCSIQKKRKRQRR